MRKSLISLVVLVIVICAMAPASAANPPQVGDYFPPFTGKLISGEDFNLESYYGQGKYILVDFWAFWCGPCKGEIPNLVTAWDMYQLNKYLMIGVNMDTPATAEKRDAYIQEVGMTFPSVSDLGGWDTAIAKQYAIRFIPQNFLLAPDGTVLFRDLRGDDVLNTIGPLMELNRTYEPITMNMAVQDDPRKSKSFKTPSGMTGVELMTNPFMNPLNVAPENIKLRLNIDNPQADKFEATLWYKVYRPTGRHTNLVKDKVTGEVMKHYFNQKPYVVYEVTVEEIEVPIRCWGGGAINTGFELPVGGDVWQIDWGIKVHSAWLGIDLNGPEDTIDFAGYWTMPVADVTAQGGLFFAEREKEGE